MGIEAVIVNVVQFTKSVVTAGTVRWGLWKRKKNSEDFGMHKLDRGVWFLVQVLLCVLLVACTLVIAYVTASWIASTQRTIYYGDVLDVKGDYVYVFESSELCRTIVFKNTDAWYLEKDSEEIRGKLEIGHQYMFDVSGKRIPWMGLFENIVHVDPVD
jgi:hypothetical protein